MEGLTTILITLFVALVPIYLFYTSRRRPKGFPPGPPSYPFIGSRFSFKLEQHKGIHHQLVQLSKQYGPIFSFGMGSQMVIALNDLASIKEALVKHNMEFAGRPQDIPFLEEYNPNYPIQGIIDSNPSDEWKRQRSNALQLLRSLGWGKNDVEERIREEARTLRDALAKHHTGKAFDPVEMIMMCVSNVICHLLFGERYSYDDPKLQNLLKNVNEFFDSIGKSDEIMLTPYIYLLPRGRKLRDDVLRETKVLNEFYIKKIKERKENMEEKNYEDPNDFLECYIKALHDGEAKITENWLFNLVSDFFLAGAETTSTTLAWAILYMAVNPHIQTKVQEHLDEVFGQSEHDFCLEDRARVPYVEATIMEIQRTASLVPLSIMHCTTADTKLKQFTIPKNTLVIPNLYHALHDPEVWPEPEVLRPERFLNEDGELVKNDNWIPFSVGRRTCLGEQLARQELFLFFSTLLHNFRITPPEGTTVLDTEPMMKFVLKPRPYEISLTKRF